MQFGQLQYSRTPPVRLKRQFRLFWFFSSSHSELCHVVCEADQRFPLMRTHPVHQHLQGCHLLPWHSPAHKLTDSPNPSYWSFRVHSHIKWPFQCLLPPGPQLALQSSHMDLPVPLSPQGAPPFCLCLCCSFHSSLSKSNLSFAIQLPRPCLQGLFDFPTGRNLPLLWAPVLFNQSSLTPVYQGAQW